MSRRRDPNDRIQPLIYEDFSTDDRIHEFEDPDVVGVIELTTDVLPEETQIVNDHSNVVPFLRVK